MLLLGKVRVMSGLGEGQRYARRRNGTFSSRPKVPLQRKVHSRVGRYVYDLGYFSKETTCSIITPSSFPPIPLDPMGQRG